MSSEFSLETDHRLHTAAYRMLGNVSDAEDAVQDARLRLMESATAPRNEPAYLMRTVVNGCIDRLRQRQRDQASYPGPWLPEPLVAPVSEQPEQRWTSGRQMSLGLLHLLEALSPEERVLYVLRHGFDYRFTEIGEFLGISEATARQRHRRAQQKLQASPAAASPSQAQRSLLEALLDKLARADVDGVAALLSADAVALTDGGGKVSAAIIPVEGRARIAQVAVHIFSKPAAAGESQLTWVTVNGCPGLCVLEDGVPVTVLTLEVEGGQAHRIYAVRNPDKLARVTAALRR
jgi:RNA polymerase sigma-70 factor (ECF subfamily)